MSVSALRRLLGSFAIFAGVFHVVLSPKESHEPLESSVIALGLSGFVALLLYTAWHIAAVVYGAYLLRQGRSMIAGGLCLLVLEIAVVASFAWYASSIGGDPWRLLQTLSSYDVLLLVPPAVTLADILLRSFETAQEEAPA